MSGYSQEARRGRLTTALGKDVLVLLRMDGDEALSSPFEWRVEALSTDHAINLDDLLGTHATVSIEMMQGVRQFDGIVTEASNAGAGENGYRYTMTLRPWLHLAGYRRNQRIFHRQTVVQILTELLAPYADLGMPHMRTALQDDYPEMEYTVQYNESDADFACRQMERFGITWSYEHTEGSHTLVLTDRADNHPKVDNGGERPFYPPEGHHMAEEEHFHEWENAARMTTGAVRMTEYNFKKPHAAQEVDHTGDAAHAHGQIESFDWPGDYLNQGEGRGVVSRNTEAERGQAPRHHAVGDIPSLGAGTRVTLTGHARDEVKGKEFLCLKTAHRYRSQAYGTGDAQADEVAYEGRYILIPSTAPLRPRKGTPAPKVQGPETAVVVGEGEIDCDAHGRILVKFHWDLAAAHTMRVRVSQNWASKGWGGMVIPRIGMEVIVEHLRGDPDKPIVTGCVYNGANTPPYPLPAHKTKSVFRSDTHQGQGFNEVAFEDEKDQENVSLHAQKDQTLKVLNNRMKRIDNDQVESVGNNKSIEISNNHQERIGGSMNLTVGGGKGALFGMLAGIAGKSVADALTVADESGNPAVPAFLAALVATRLGGEVASDPKIGDFDAAGRNAKVAGADQVAKGTALGSLLSSVMPMSGIKNSVIEKFQSDTIGIARTEQIGAFKNTMVGMVQNTLVGLNQYTKVGTKQDTNVGDAQHLEVGRLRTMKTGDEEHNEIGRFQTVQVGDEQRLKVGRLRTIETGEEYTNHTGRRAAHSAGALFSVASGEKFEGTAKVWEIKAEDTVLLSAPGGYIEITKSGVKIRGKKVEIEGNTIDLRRGGPGEGSKCLRAMAKSATPFVR